MHGTQQAKNHRRAYQPDKDTDKRESGLEQDFLVKKAMRDVGVEEPGRAGKGHLVQGFIEVAGQEGAD